MKRKITAFLQQLGNDQPTMILYGVVALAAVVILVLLTESYFTRWNRQRKNLHNQRRDPRKK